MEGTRPIVLWCTESVRDRWMDALALYEVLPVGPGVPFAHILEQAAQARTHLLVVVDGVQQSDDELVEGLWRFRQNHENTQVGQQNATVRVAFVAQPGRPQGSELYRALANLDVYDIIAPSAECATDCVEGAFSRETMSPDLCSGQGDWNADTSPVPIWNGGRICVPTGQATFPVNPYLALAQVITRPQSYADIVPLVSGAIANPRLSALSHADLLREQARNQARIAVAQLDERRGGSTHTTFALARVLVLLGYKTAVFLDARTWDALWRCYPRASCNVAAGLVALSGIDFYKNSGFSQVNGYDYVLADFGFAGWTSLDAQVRQSAFSQQKSFDTAQVGILTSVVSPFGDQQPFERVLNVWQDLEQLHNVARVKFAFFGIPRAQVLDNWRTVARGVSEQAELYALPYLPDSLRYEPEAGAPDQVLLDLLAPVLHQKDRP